MSSNRIDGLKRSQYINSNLSIDHEFMHTVITLQSDPRIVQEVYDYWSFDQESLAWYCNLEQIDAQDAQEVITHYWVDTLDGEFQHDQDPFSDDSQAWHRLAEQFEYEQIVVTVLFQKFTRISQKQDFIKRYDVPLAPKYSL